VHDYLTTDEPAFAADMNIQGVYTHGPYPALGPTYALSRLGYSHAPALPTILLETTYEGEHGASVTAIRGFMWGAQLSTIGGVIFGNLPVWNLGAGWQAALGSPGARDMQRMAALLDALPWHQLVPSALAGMKTLVTAGAGTYATYARGEGASGGDDWVVSAATPDGRVLVAYVPDAHRGAVTIDLTALARTSRARWYDPTSGAFTNIGSVPNTGTRAFTTPGNNAGGAADWVLLIDPQ
jgi:hypothetical protein